jgi:hypothetical protein
MRPSLEPTDPRLPEIAERLKQNGVLIRESRALGYTHNGPLRAALRRFLGAAEFNRIMQENVTRRLSCRRPPAPKPSSSVASGQSA